MSIWKTAVVPLFLFCFSLSGSLLAQGNNTVAEESLQQIMPEDENFLNNSVEQVAGTYVISNSSLDVGNPGGLRTAADFTTTGGTSVLNGGTGSTTVNYWSAPVAIPFSFNFYGSPVTHFIVSKNGLVSFDTSNANMPVGAALNINTALPNPSLPDNTLAMFWEDTSNTSISTFDHVYVYTYGTAPNRQFWIHYYSFEVGTQSFCYWAAVLEESTDRIYVIDMNYGDDPANYTGTVGVQVDGSTAYQVTTPLNGLNGSPNIAMGTSGSANGNNEYYIIEYFPPGACVPPFGLSTSNITSTTADVSFTPGGASDFNLEYGPAGFALGSGIQMNLTSSSTTISGLSPNTSYDVYVRDSCGVGDVSSWVGPLSFRTLCSFFTAPYSENFDAVSTPDLPTCWSKIEGGNAIQTVTSTDHGTPIPSPPNAVEINDAPAGVDQILVSPGFSDLPSGANRVTMEVSFEGGTSGNPIIDTLYVGVMTDPTDPNTLVVLDTIVYPMVDDLFRKIIVDLDNTGLIGSANFIAIKYADGGGGWEFFIDDFVYEVIPPCVEPTSLSASASSSSSAQLSWMENGTATSWDIEWGVSGFTPGSGMVVTGVSNNPYMLTGLSPATTYDYYVRADCGASGKSAWSGPASFTTDCASLTAPYFQNFDGAPAQDPFGGIPCWSVTGPGANDIELNDSPDFGVDPAPSQPNSVELNDGDFDGGDTAILVSPIFSDLPSGANRIRFKAAFESTSAELIIGVMTDPTDGSTLVILDTVTSSTADDYNEYTVNLDNTAAIGAAEHIALVHGSSSFEIYVDDFNYEVLPSCLSSTGLSASNITNSSAEISWIPGDGTSFNIQYGQAGFSLGSGTIMSGVGNPTTIMGLTGNTSYDVYVQDDCGSSTSIWAGPLTFTTLCDAVTTYPQTEDFESSSDIPVCWSENSSGSFAWDVDNNGTSSTNTGPDVDHTLGTTSGNYIYTEASSGSSGDSALLVSPLLDLSSLTNPQLVFWYHMYGEDITELQVDAWNSATMSWDSIFALSGQQQTSNADAWKEAQVDLSGVSSNTQIRFSHVKLDFDGDVALDDITIREAPACPAPSLPNASNITTNSADLQWTSASGSLFNIEYGPSGFTPGSGTVVNGVSNPYALSGLSADTDYDFYVQNDCGADGTSTWTGPASFSTPCLPKALTFNENFGPSFPSCWTTNDPSNVFTTNSCATSSGYSLELDGIPGVFAESPMIDVSGESAVELRYFYRAGGSGCGNAPEGSDSVRVDYWDGSNWVTLIKYNDDNVSTFTEEKFIITSGLSSSFRIRFYLISGTGDGLDNWNFDSVQVAPPPACPQPTNLGATNLSQQSVDVFWTSGGAINWQIEYGPQGFVPGTGTLINASNDTATISGLSANTSYDVYVRDSCGVGNVSSWVGPLSFTTLCNTFTAPFMEGFESGSPSRSCWYNEYVQDTQDWTIGTGSSGGAISTAHAGSENAVFVSANNGPDITRWVSPQIDISSLTDPELRFWYGQEVWFGDQNYLNVYYRTSTAAPWMLLWSDSTNQPSWTEAIVTLPTGNTVQLAFEGINNWGRANVLDDVQVDEAPSCPAPLALGSMNPDTSSVTVYWNGGTATNWIMEYGPTGFTPGSGTTVSVSNDTATLSGLMPATAYDFYVQADCGSGVVSTVVGPSSFTTTVCDTSQQCNFTANLSDNFGDGWNNGEMGIYQNGVLVATFGSNFTGGSSFGPVNLGLCDGIMAHLVVLNQGGFPGEIGFDVNDPFGTNVVSVAEGNLTQSTGDTVISFMVNCSQPTCPVPTNLGAFNADTSSVKIFWDGGSETNFIVEYGPAGFTPGSGTTVNVSNDTTMLMGLMSATNYDFYVQTDCGSGNLSSQAGPFGFSTVVCAAAQQCAFSATLIDDFGDGWNGAEITVYQAGVPVATLGSGFGSGGTFGPLNLPLCDNLMTYIVLSTEGSFPSEVGFDISNPLGAILGSYTPASGTSQGDTLAVFNSSCTLCPTDQVFVNDSICEGDSILIGGMYRNSTGVYVDSLTNSIGCDSVVTIDLQVIPTIIVNKMDSICQGDSILIAGNYVKTAGVYNEVYTSNVTGCDSICAIQVIVKPSYNMNASAFICQGDSIFLGGAYQTTGGVYIDTYTTDMGCDSIVNTTLEIGPTDLVNKTQEICQGDSILLGGTYRSTAGTYYDTLTNSAGCDSVCATQLIVKPNKTVSADGAICQGDSILLGGAYQKTSGTYTDVYTAANGCDSTVITTLTVHPSYDIVMSDSICDGDSIMIGGMYRSTAGSYSTTYSTVNNCDSTVTVNLSIIPGVTMSKSDSICQGDSIMLAGAWRMSSGTYCDTLVGSNGCDSVCCTTLTVIPPVSSSKTESICQGDSILLGGAYRTEAGTYCDTLVAASGCDSIVCTTLNILQNTVVTMTDSICQGDSIMIGGMWRTTSGFYCDTVVSANGCSGIFCTDLTVLPNTTVTKTQTICQGDSAWLEGMWQTSSGTYYDTLVAANGCDSICVTTLNVLPNVTVNKTETICQGDSMMFGGMWRMTSGIYYDTLVAANGCDSICATTLNVLPNVTVNKTESICQGDSMMLGGMWQTTAGTYYDTLMAANGCDSVCITSLSVLPTYTTNLTVTICPGDSAMVAGSYRTMSGTYTSVMMTADGCDSTVNTTLVLDSTGCTYDCNGDLNGTAFIDACGTCVGGNTGLTPCTPGCVSLEVVSLTLVDASTGMDVRTLTNGDTIDKSILPQFSVRANTCSGPVGSVIFDVNGAPFSRENLPPYAIKGGSVTHYNAWNPIAGTYKVVATPYSMGNGKGTAGVAESLTVVITDTMPTLDCNGDLGGTAYIDSCGVCVGGNTGKTACTTACSMLEVISFSLVNASNGMLMRPLNDGDTIYLGSIGSFSVRANTCNGTVGSVWFDLNGSITQKENLYPYDINGGSFSVPNPWFPPVGTHTLIATPYSGGYGSGATGISETVNFTVMSGFQARTEGDDGNVVNEGDGISESQNGLTLLDQESRSLQIRVYPNPTYGLLNIIVSGADKDQEVMIFDGSGKLIRSVEPVELKATESSYEMDISNYPKGMYLIKIRSGEEIFTRRVIRN